MARLNDLIHQHASRNDRFVTLAAAVLDLERHEVALINAGHLTPLLYRRATGKLEDAMAYRAGGPPLGLVKGQTYGTTRVGLHAGDCLLFFTDGVSEAFNLQKQKFEIEGIHRALQEAGTIPTPFPWRARPPGC